MSFACIAPSSSVAVASTEKYRLFQRDTSGSFGAFDFSFNKGDVNSGFGSAMVLNAAYKRGAGEKEKNSRDTYELNISCERVYKKQYFSIDMYHIYNFYIIYNIFYI